VAGKGLRKKITLSHDEKEEGREKGGKREKIVKINDKSVRNIENISSSYSGRRKEGREGGSMDKLQSARRSLGRVYNFRSGHVHGWLRTKTA
jgi:hypothetical protein